MLEKTNTFGIIGGTGFYNLDSPSTDVFVKTPFGKVQVNMYDIMNQKVAFIARHGREHSVPPHLINYRANILAFYKLGINKIISTSAVGSLQRKYQPGHFILPNQFIDFTKSRTMTFFDGKFSVDLSNKKILQGVIHRDLTTPYCSAITKALFHNITENNQVCHQSAIYVCTEGPRFETTAEINALRILGGDIVGMTNAPEIILARELGMCYGAICLVTNFAAGMQEKITIEEVIELFDKKKKLLRAIITNTIKTLTKEAYDCSCRF